MSSISLENRVSLTQKSVDLVSIIEDLSSDYYHREDFMRKRPHHLFEEARLLITSEICNFPLCAGVAGFVLAVGAYAYLYIMVADTAVLCTETAFFDCYASANDKMTYYVNVV